MKAKIVNCLSAGIRKNIDDPNTDQTILKNVDSGETIEIDTTVTGYDWKDNQFYKCTSPVEGWINQGVVEV